MAPSTQTPGKGVAPDPSELEPLIELGLTLIPLKARSKAPQDVGWTERDYSGLDAAAHAANGGNVGVRLDGLMVVDADPRNYVDGDDPLARAEADGLVPPDAPRVVTGGERAGLHVYTRLAAPDPRQYETLEGYPGLEFKAGHRRQVVAPGSVHPDTGDRYVIDPIDDFSQPIPEAPRALLDAVRRPEPGSAASTREQAPHAPWQVASMLEALDPDAVSADGGGSDSPWFRLMCACHHASGGDAVDEFVEWSTRAAGYGDHAHLIRSRWESLGRRGDGDAQATAGTLWHMLEAAGRLDAWLAPADEVADDFADEPEVPDAATGERPDEPERKEPDPLPSGKPMTVAREMLRGKAVLRSRGDWLAYEPADNCYRAMDDERFEARVWRYVDGRLYDSPDGPKRMAASRDVVGNVVAAARAQRQGPTELPAWWPRRDGDPDPGDVLPVRNGLLNTRTMELLSASRRFVSPCAAAVDYDPEAAPPERWERFLAEVFEDDAETVGTLQEIMGYLLSQDTSQQKIFALVGPPRCGKGTINRVLQALIGRGNYCSPTAGDLAKGDFNLQSLLGKQLATISDMRMGRGADPSKLAENLLRISGEDEVSVNRKYKDPWEGRLPTRFLLLSNEVPQFRDTSGAIVSRMVLARSHASFLGREDQGLQAALLSELPGVLNWCLEGLRRLRARGHFLQPAASRDELDEMMSLASPVSAFARSRLREEVGAEAAKEEVWDAFQEFLFERGLPYGGDRAHLFKDLKTVGLRFRDARLRGPDGGRRYCVTGVRLLEEEG